MIADSLLPMFLNWPPSPNTIAGLVRFWGTFRRTQREKNSVTASTAPRRDHVVEGTEQCERDLFGCRRHHAFGAGKAIDWDLVGLPQPFNEFEACLPPFRADRRHLLGCLLDQSRVLLALYEIHDEHVLVNCTVNGRDGNAAFLQDLLSEHFVAQSVGDAFERGMPLAISRATSPSFSYRIFPIGRQRRSRSISMTRQPIVRSTHDAIYARSAEAAASASSSVMSKYDPLQRRGCKGKDA